MQSVKAPTSPTPQPVSRLAVAHHLGNSTRNICHDRARQPCAIASRRLTGKPSNADVKTNTSLSPQDLHDLLIRQRSPETYFSGFDPRPAGSSEIRLLLARSDDREFRGPLPDRSAGRRSEASPARVSEPPQGGRHRTIRRGRAGGDISWRAGSGHIHPVGNSHHTRGQRRILFDDAVSNSPAHCDNRVPVRPQPSRMLVVQRIVAVHDAHDSHLRGQCGADAGMPPVIIRNVNAGGPFLEIRAQRPPAPIPCGVARRGAGASPGCHLEKAADRASNRAGMSSARGHHGPGLSIREPDLPRIYPHRSAVPKWLIRARGDRPAASSAVARTTFHRPRSTPAHSPCSPRRLRAGFRHLQNGKPSPVQKA